MKLKIQTKFTGLTTMYLILDGELDTNTASDLDQLIIKLDNRITNLVFDLQKLNFISSAGLRIFAKARKIMKSRQGQICFINLTPQVKKVFNIVKAVPISEVFQSTEELDAYLMKMQNKNIDH
ncbi:STAS domain-containing protein [Geminocystis sp. GBBB08]|uniref:STAS domain-containing protein n=1 Tax=Geminocystis sp. GBBB08 TaxID=2604140 RepID=UPI0027E27487|nr:STAS domain-containing protein [Geminocystis sp. GBBB08]MBL1209457.1 STAS domain-containing protein [Geminocystis sp. GBBB08]